jgi:4-hydroxy-2-oxoheptanedioate aldolase
MQAQAPLPKHRGLAPAQSSNPPTLPQPSPMRNNTVREKLHAGQAVIGLQMGLGSPAVAEMMGYVGFDWLVIETEHNAIDFSGVEHMLMAMNSTDVVPLVRTPSGDPTIILRALDSGAMGLLVPMLRTAEEAAAVVAATRYPPHGIRGFGPLRASQYTMDYPDYLARANDNILVSFILETKEALENLEEIMAVPGVDALYFGLFDLCISMGLNPMEMPFPEIEDAMARAVELSRKTGVAVGVGVGSPEDLQKRLDQGMRFITYGTDYILLQGAAKTGIDAFREYQAK